GQGKVPALGVRPSDAESFCEWLTERESGEWRYRLPTMGEVSGDERKKLLASGYWARVEQSGYRYIGEPGSAITAAMIGHRMINDWFRNTSLTRALDLDPILARTRSLARALDLDRARTRARALDRALDLALDRTRDRALDLALALALARTRT